MDTTEDGYGHDFEHNSVLVSWLVQNIPFVLIRLVILHGVKRFFCVIRVGMERMTTSNLVAFRSFPALSLEGVKTRSHTYYQAHNSI